MFLTAPNHRKCAGLPITRYMAQWVKLDIKKMQSEGKAQYSLFEDLE
jgi:hypothetical protein